MIRGITMEVLRERDVLDTVFNYDMRVVPEATRFWMIRTNKGYFYNDFIINNYVALGWNIIDKETDLSEQSLEQLKMSLIQDYDEKIPTAAINKCKNFIYEIKEGDMIIIPSAKTQYVTFALAGEYYEEDKTYEEEVDIVSRIKDNNLQLTNIVCPYRKRRHITILKTVKSENINYHLYRGITTYHGISNFDSYSTFILDSIYNLYSFGEIFSLQIGVNTQNPIKARDITNLMYGITEYMCSFIDEEDLTITLNLNSPGRLSLKAKKAFDHVKNNKAIYLFILIAVTGGKGLGFELNGVPHLLKECATLNYAIEKEKIEIEMQKAEALKQEFELEKMKLENLQKKYELANMLKEDKIDVESLSQNIDIILNSSKTLELGINDNIEVEQVEQIIGEQVNLFENDTENIEAIVEE